MLIILDIIYSCETYLGSALHSSLRDFTNLVLNKTLSLSLENFNIDNYARKCHKN